MKSNEELNALKEEIETRNEKLRDLTDEELEQAAGGHHTEYDTITAVCLDCGKKFTYQVRSGAYSPPRSQCLDCWRKSTQYR